MKQVIIAVAAIVVSNAVGMNDLTIYPRQPADLSVAVAGTRLTFDPPETRLVEFTAKAPRNYGTYFEKWDPWPGNGADGKPNVIGLTPRRDEDGVLILGGLYRSFIADSVEVTSADGTTKFTRGTDYAYNADWGQIANLNGKLGKEFEADLKVKAQYILQRLDLVQADKAGKLNVKKGQSRMVCPALPEPDAGCRGVAAVYVTGTGCEVLPIDPKPPVAPVNPQAVARTLAKLRAGKSVTIAFMGDSITLGAEAGSWWDEQLKFTVKDLTYRGRVIYSLRQRFPQATITPVEASQGATGIQYGLEQFPTKVLPAKPDLIFIAFGANDASGTVGDEPKTPPARFQQDLLALTQQAKVAGSEVVLLTTMELNPCLKNGVTKRWPAYQQAIVDVAQAEHVGLADVHTEWLNLAARGIPPVSQLHNGINHPGPFGHGVYADVLLRFFPAETQPDKIPGAWKLTPQPLPPLAEILKRPTPELPVYGLYTWTGEYRSHRESIRKVGWKSFRVGGPMNDDDMKMFIEDETEVVKTLTLAPPKKNRQDYNTDAAFIADYINGVESFLTRYGQDGTFFRDNQDLPKRPIQFIEIWNEPNFRYMIPDREPHATVEAEREALYAKLLPAAYAAVKKKWPTVQVVGFSAGGSSAGDLRFFDHVFAQEPAVAKSFDILATHPYVAPAPPECDAVHSWGSYSIAKSLKTIRQTMARHCCADRPIWYTEVGWPISQTDGGIYPSHETEAVTPLLQAAYVVRLYALTMRLGVDRTYIMFTTDTDNYNAGFFLRDDQWRPAAHAVRTMIRLLPHPKLTGVLADGEDGYFAYWFAPRMLMIWDVTGPKTVSIPWTDNFVRITDMVGEEKTLPVTTGTVQLRIGPCPIYLQ